jgi:hypothetical protein
MKNAIAIFYIMGLYFTSGNLNAQSMLPEKILIVYLSRTNNTKVVAEIIQEKVGGCLMAIELEKPYPENYQAAVQQVVKENETGFLLPKSTYFLNAT